MRSRVLLALTLLAYAVLMWLRWPEPLGLDQSLFALYGHWCGRGMALYRELWDSKPPGIFLLYALADRTAGAVHSAWALDVATALGTGFLGARLARDLSMQAGFTARDAARAAWVAGLYGLFLWSAPVFGGPYVAGQAEACMTPLLLGAVLWARRTTARSAAGCGLLLGMAVLLKLVALAAVPVVWLFAPAAARRNRRRTGWIVAGLVLPAVAAVAVLAAQGALADAVQAVLVYPRAYGAEIAARSSVWDVLQRGGVRLGRGLPLLLVLVAAGLWTAWRTAPSLGRALAVWLGLAAVAVTAQLQMAGYHLLFLAPPFCVLAGLGAPGLARTLAATWQGSQRGEPRAAGQLAVLALVLVAGAGSEARLWKRQYAPHVQHRTGSIDRAAFLLRLGGPGPLWSEAETIAGAIRARPLAGAGARAAPAPSMFVWGLAPSLYVLAEARPAARYAFHQTFYVADSPLSQRWPGAAERRMELLESLRRDAPEWVVIVHKDRSGLEPRDSAAELVQFPPLSLFFDERYEPRARTSAYALLARRPVD